MRKALIVGINYYDVNDWNLSGCVPDAYNVNAVLSDNSDGTKNFDTKMLIATDANNRITKADLKAHVKELFKDDNDIALLYFSGHGYIESTGGYLVTSDCTGGDEGLLMDELLKIVNNESKAKNRIIILDTCHSGAMGNHFTSGSEDSKSLIDQGVTILTASASDGVSMDEGDGGTFTKLFVDALQGAASNLLGDVSSGSVYAHIDQSLGSWEQRPIFKTNVKNFVSLRKTQPPLQLSELKKIAEIFDESFEFQLDPTYEPDNPDKTAPEPIPENVEIFSLLQKYNRLNLVIPVDAPHMYYAAVESKKCKLTVVGEYYWGLIKRNRI